MRVAFLTILFIDILSIFAQPSNTAAEALSLSQDNADDFSTSLKIVNDANKSKKDKICSLINLIKSVLSEELDGTSCQITDDINKETPLSILNSTEDINTMSYDIDVLQEKKEKNDTYKENNTETDKTVCDNVQPIVTFVLNNKNNTTNELNSSTPPSMIPIFKPSPTKRRKQLKDNFAENLSTSQVSRQILNQAPIAIVPNKNVQSNVSPMPTTPAFNIPCQRAADVLDMTVTIPRGAKLESVSLNTSKVRSNMSPVAQTQKLNSSCLAPSPVTLSVNCEDSKDTVAMLFKPKAISLMQLYGNLLKKITFTVLVPYHMSKLGGN